MDYNGTTHVFKVRNVVKYYAENHGLSYIWNCFLSTNWYYKAKTWLLYAKGSSERAPKWQRWHIKELLWVYFNSTKYQTAKIKLNLADGAGKQVIFNPSLSPVYISPDQRILFGKSVLFFMYSYRKLGWEMKTVMDFHGGILFSLPASFMFPWWGLHSHTWEQPGLGYFSKLWLHLESSTSFPPPPHLKVIKKAPTKEQCFA